MNQASDPPQKLVPGRRLFAVAVGLGVGGVTMGYLGRALLERLPTQPVSPIPSKLPHEDETVAWIRKVCREGSVSEIVKHRVVIYQYLPRYPEDSDLWHGLDRLVKEIIGDPGMPDRKRMAMEFCAVFDHSDLPMPATEWDLKALRTIAKQG